MLPLILSKFFSQSFATEFILVGINIPDVLLTICTTPQSPAGITVILDNQDGFVEPIPTPVPTPTPTPVPTPTPTPVPTPTPAPTPEPTPTPTPSLVSTTGTFTTSSPTRTFSNRGGTYYADDYALSTLMPGLVAGQKVRINHDMPAIDAYLYVLNADTGVVVGANDDFGSSNSQITLTIADGVNYVVVPTMYPSSTAATPLLPADYTLTLTLVN